MCGIEHSASSDFFREAYDETNFTHVDHDISRCGRMGLWRGGSQDGCVTTDTASAALNGLFVERALSVLGFAITERSEQIDREY